MIPDLSFPQQVLLALCAGISAAGWAFQVNTGAWWTSRMSPEGVAELYADGSDLMMAASFSPPQRAEKVPGGYRITGRGPLASTIHDSQWVLMSALVFDGDQPRMTPHGPQIISVVMRTSEVEIIDTWYVSGLKGTGSQDLRLDDAFVAAIAPKSAANSGRLRPACRAPTSANIFRSWRRAPTGWRSSARCRMATRTMCRRACRQ